LLTTPRQATHHSLPSPDGVYIATLHANHLQIYRTKRLALHRTITLPPDFASRVSCIRWSRTRHHHHQSTTSTSTTHRQPQPEVHQRILLADPSTIRIYSTHNPQWTATITHPSGSVADPSPSHIAFGHSANDVLLFDAFGTRLKICFLDSGRSVEVRDPKIATLRNGHFHGHGHAYSYRRQTGHLALLTRPAAQDIVTLHAPVGYEVVGSFSVPMVDAQGVQWSGDGRWLGAWEAAGAGFKVVVFTADGHLYRCYEGGGGDGEGDGAGEVGGLGVRGIEWSPRGDYLAVAGYDGRVTLLGTTTVRCLPCSDMRDARGKVTDGCCLSSSPPPSSSPTLQPSIFLAPSSGRNTSPPRPGPPSNDLTSSPPNPFALLHPLLPSRHLTPPSTPPSPSPPSTHPAPSSPPDATPLPPRSTSGPSPHSSPTPPPS